MTYSLVAFYGLALLMLKGHKLIVEGAVDVGLPLFSAAVIFISMASVSYLISYIGQSPLGTKLQREFVMLQADDAGDLSIAFYLGFIGWISLLSLQGSKLFSTVALSIPTLPLSSTLSTSGQGLTTAQSYFVNGMVAPPVEELFFGAGLPTTILGVFSILIMAGIPYLTTVLKNDLVQIATLTLISSVTFATFHTGAEVFSGFWIFAFTFSAVLRGLIFGDVYENWVPSIALLGSFIMGAHTGNNFQRLGGFFEVMNGLMGEPILFLITVSLFTVFAVSALGRLREVFLG